MFMFCNLIGPALGILAAGETPAPQPETTTASIVVQASSLQKAARAGFKPARSGWKPLPL